MRPLGRRLAGPDLVLAGVGGAVTLVTAYASVRMGAQIGIGALLVATVYLAALAGFLTIPHLTVAATIVLFTLVPALKVFLADWVGSVKDLVVLAAVSAGVLLFVFERRWPDRRVLVLVALLLGLYFVNVGGGHGIAWVQGMRLVGEPLLLLLVGFMLPEPQRTFRWALGSLVVAACVAGAYGVLQHVVFGPYTLVSWGYSFTKQVRTVDGQLRSFGTFDDPFAYAAFLLLGIGALIFYVRRGAFAWTAGGLLLVGLAFSYVRTAELVLLGFIGLSLARRGNLPAAMLVVGGTAVAALVILGSAGGTQTRTYHVTSRHGTLTQTAESGNVVLNGRISAWEAALGHDPRQWLFGRGVGKVGTAATRATYAITPSAAQSGALPSALAVDSGYLATIADVGIAGLAILLMLFARLVVLAGRAAARNSTAGWAALALLVCLLLDALTRASFTGFPPAFLGLLLVGLGLAAAAEDSPPAAPHAR